jgi:hypothetical protein
LGRDNEDIRKNEWTDVIPAAISTLGPILKFQLSSKYGKSQLSYFTNPSNEDNHQWKTTSKRRQPPMEDDFKILTVEYISNH